MNIIDITEDNVEEFVPLIGEDLAEDLERLYFHGIGAVNDQDEAIGALVYELLGSEGGDVKSFIRLQKSDSRETEDELQKHYKRDAVDNDEIEESYYEVPDEEIADSCEAAGFSKEKKESIFLRATLADILKTKFAQKSNVPKYIKCLGELSIMEYRSAVKDMLFRGQKGIAEDLAYLPMTWYDKDVSVCSTSDAGVDGLFLIRCMPSGILMPVFYYAYGPYYVKNLAYMLIKSIAQAAQKYPPETPIVICRSKQASRDMAAKIMPGAKGEEVFYGSRKEEC